MKVWKYKIPLAVPPPDGADHFTIGMPQGARVIKVAAQRGVPCLWAEVDPDRPECSYSFALVWTGQGDVPGGYDHAGSVEDDSGFVWHVYQKRFDDVPFAGDAAA